MKSCSFIELDDTVCVLMPTNWLEGWNRQRWLERYFGKEREIKNISFEYWESLRKKKKTYLLKEESGKYKVSLLENPDRLIIKIANALREM